MNKAQRIVVLTGITIIALLCLFPPWKATFPGHTKQETDPVGYGLIFYPPTHKHKQGLTKDYGDQDYYEIDVKSLHVRLYVHGSSTFTTRCDDDRPHPAVSARITERGTRTWTQAEPCHPRCAIHPAEYRMPRSTAAFQSIQNSPAGCRHELRPASRKTSRRWYDRYCL